ncbi:hypothetical protein ACCI51_09375, partial [Microbulbifer echini]
PMTSVYVTTKTLQTDGGGVVNVAEHVADLVASCIVEVANSWPCIALYAAMAIPSGQYWSLFQWWIGRIASTKARIIEPWLISTESPP